MTTDSDGPAGGFPTPPREFTDEEGREIGVRSADAAETETDPLCQMYLDFDPADRAQGIPPVEEESIRDWLDLILTQDSFNVVAWHGDRAVGHATLVPDETGAYELAIFVLDSYQGAYVGTELVRSLLGLARAEDIAYVWLTVERWNDPAIRLYRSVGFETTDSQSFEMEMTISLAG
ncbi:MAG: acetyltransferase [uncultured archaeon A07HR67]|jgi:Acetyltransferases|nr:MAG: acetyltransferase [uncultured archaeon A07HR67]